MPNVDPRTGLPGGSGPAAEEDRCARRERRLAEIVSRVEALERAVSPPVLPASGPEKARGRRGKAGTCRREDDVRPFARPAVVMSRCLLGEACRYDGRALPAGFAGKLLPHVRAIPVCPELSIGLGVPRAPLRVERAGKGGPARLVQPSTGRDLTRRLAEFRERFLRELPRVDGFLLKSRSPSCAVRDAKEFPPGGEDVPRARGPGVFAEAVLALFPLAAVEDEVRLARPRSREHFLTRLFTTAAFREEVGRRPSWGRLAGFHARNVLLLETLGREARRDLAGLAADRGRRSARAAAAAYETRLRAALRRPPTVAAHLGVLLAVADRLGTSAGTRAKARFLDALAGYRAGRLPLSAPVAAARALAGEHAAADLAAPTYRHPVPPELAEADPGGRG